MLRHEETRSEAENPTPRHRLFRRSFCTLQSGRELQGSLSYISCSETQAIFPTHFALAYAEGRHTTNSRNRGTQLCLNMFLRTRKYVANLALSHLFVLHNNVCLYCVFVKLNGKNSPVPFLRTPRCGLIRMRPRSFTVCFQTRHPEIS